GVWSVLALSAITMRQEYGSSALRWSCSLRIEPGSAACSLKTGTTISMRGASGIASARARRSAERAIDIAPPSVPAPRGACGQSESSLSRQVRGRRPADRALWIVRHGLPRDLHRAKVVEPRRAEGRRVAQPGDVMERLERHVPAHDRAHRPEGGGGGGTAASLLHQVVVQRELA